MNINQFQKNSKKISSDPFSRVPSHILPLIKDTRNLINAHCHIFNDKSLPKTLFNMKMPYSKRLMIKFAKSLHKINGKSNDDWGSRNAYFIEMFIKTTKEITDKLISYYPKNTIFTPLMMDMHNRSGSDKRKPTEYYIKEQAKDIKKLIDDKYNLLPFFPIDPTSANNTNSNEKDVLDIFIKAFTGGYGITPLGIKIYPSLGYLPSHPKLMEIFKICEEKNIPITAHCSSGIVHTHENYIKNIQGWKIGKDGQLTNKTENRWFFGGKKYATYFNHPKNWEPVLNAFPKLRLNLAHFGSNKEWLELLDGKNNTWPTRIIDYFMRFENVYSDISYTNSETKLFDILSRRIEKSKIIKERVLFGMDYYMVVVEGHYRGLKANFLSAMGDEIIHQIGNINTRKFLFGEIY
ncbi:MAG: amidohydrolase family protein [Candidatus Marinimicrobia bacterium]|nr:amidohydrolase family protein [Candidatus Neomarinimicrobiota bacterium]